MKNFPHIADNSAFPGLPENTFATQSRYDYTLWDANTRLKLCNVNWRSDYRNVVDFKTDTARDAYFDKVKGYDSVLESQYRMLPTGNIKLPLPFDEVVRYNYLMVDFGKSPNPLETASHVGRYFFFVENCSFAANNTTDLTLTLDAWTTYINRVNVNYMMLERGHAPMAKVSVADYLADPINHTRYLMADDVNFGQGGERTPRADFVPFGNGTKLILFATTIPLEDWNEAGLGALCDVSPQGPGYYSDGTRSGADAALTTLAYAGGGMDPTGLRLSTRTTVGSNGACTPSNLTFVAIRADDAYGSGEFFNDLAARYPQALESIQAIYMVDNSMVALSGGSPAFPKRTLYATWREAAESGKTWADITAAGRTYADVDANSRAVFLDAAPSYYYVFYPMPVTKLLSQVKLSPEDFGYPDEYAGIAKLYTYPYAFLEVSDDTGATAEVHIENTGDLRVWRQISLCAPYISSAVYLRGVGSNDSVEYEWRSLTGDQQYGSVPQGRFRDLLFEYEVPAYELYMSGYDAYRLHNYNANNTIPQLNDSVAYENAARGANTSAANTADSVAKTYANTSLAIETNVANTRRSALTALANAQASNATGQTNANASAATGYDNAIDSAETGYTNASASANTAYNNAETSAATAQTNANASATTGYTNAEASALTGWNNANASADAGFTNAKTSSAASRKQAEASALAAKTNTTNSINTTRQVTTNSLASQTSQLAVSNAAAVTKTNYGNELQQALQAWEAGFDRDTQDVENITSIMTGISNAAAGIVSMAGGKATGDVGDLVGGGVQAVGAAVGTIATVAMGNYTTELGITLSQNKLNENVKNATDLVTTDTETAATNNATNQSTVTTNADLQQSTGLTNAGNSYSVAIDNAALSETTSNTTAENTANTSKSNAKASYDVAIANAKRSRDLSLDNAQRSYNTSITTAERAKFLSIGNAQRSLSTSEGNAERSRDTTLANAQRSRDTGDANAQRSFELSIANLDATTSKDRANAVRDRDTALANNEYARVNSIESSQRSLNASAETARLSYLDHKFDPAVTIGTSSGDPTPDQLKWRGLKVQLNTQAEGEIAQAGDVFARYGYALNQMWSFSGFQVMRHFTFWKCSDVWLTSAEGVIESARRIIEQALRDGVTVWSDPDEIGEVSIYENA